MKNKICHLFKIGDIVRPNKKYLSDYKDDYNAKHYIFEITKVDDVNVYVKNVNLEYKCVSRYWWSGALEHYKPIQVLEKRKTELLGLINI